LKQPATDNTVTEAEQQKDVLMRALPVFCHSLSLLLGPVASLTSGFDFRHGVSC